MLMCEQPAMRLARCLRLIQFRLTLLHVAQMQSWPLWAPLVFLISRPVRHSGPGPQGWAIGLAPGPGQGPIGLGLGPGL